MSITLGDLADELADRYDDDRGSALQVVTTYAVQCGHTSLPEGAEGDPDYVVGPVDAEHIRNAYHAGAQTDDFS